MRKNKKMIIIVLLLFIVLGMGVGYSILSKQLKIEGNASIATNFDVAITGITRLDNDSTSKYYNPTLDIYQNYQYSTDERYYNTAVENKQPSFTSTTATFDVTFNNPNDSITYVVDIYNQSNVGAILDEIVVEDTQSAVVVTPLYDYSKDSITLSSYETLRYFITISYPQYNDIVGGTNSNVTINFTFNEYTGAGYSGPENMALLTFGDELNHDGQLALAINNLVSGFDYDINLYVSIDGADYIKSDIDYNIEPAYILQDTEIYYSIPESLNDGELHTIKFKLGNSIDSRYSNEIELKYQK